MEILGRGGNEGLFCYCSESFCANETCSVVGGQCFHSVHSLKVGRGWEELSVYGCAAPEDDRSQLQCHGYLTSHRFKVPQNISCCHKEDFCNLYLNTQLKLPPSEDDSLSTPAIIVLCFAVVFVFLLIIFVLYCATKKKGRRGNPENAHARDKSLLKPLINGAKFFTRKKERLIDLETSCYDMGEPSSGSGSGPPTLVQTTIARQLDFVRSIGKGRYGEVWMGRWRGEEVAVKLFFTTEEASWENEKEIYQSVMLRHENVLGFIAADIGGHQSVTKMLLVTDYHEKGSLYDFLKLEPPLSPGQAFRLAASAASGLAHLHMEIRGCRNRKNTSEKKGKKTEDEPGTTMQEKSAIAHRDIKSKNILVKMSGGECAIADFGLAVRKDRDSGVAVVRGNNRVGTKRYMSPEILSNNLNSQDFDGYTRADMYAFALVLWEISGRVEEDAFDGGSNLNSAQQRTGTLSDDSGVWWSPESGTISPSGSGGLTKDMETTTTVTLTTSSLHSPDASHADSGGEGATRHETSEIVDSQATTVKLLGGKTCGAAPYMCPFGDLVPSDPSFEQMRKIVCLDGIRPQIREEWFRGQEMKAFVRIMKECWRESPEARLNALRVKKDLKALSRAHQHTTAGHKNQKC